MDTAYATHPVVESSASFDPSSHSLDTDPRLQARQPAKDSYFLAIHGSTKQADAVKLGTLFDSRFHVIQPIPVVYTKTEGGVAAVWEEIDEFGYADSASSACVELGKAIAQLYVSLEGEQLGSDLSRVAAVLKRHITKNDR